MEDFREQLDETINKMILENKEWIPATSRRSGKSTGELVMTMALFSRMEERKLVVKNFWSNVTDKEVYAIQYTGDCVQKEVIRQWLNTRRVYFCYSDFHRADVFVCPGVPSSIVANPDDWLVVSCAGGLYAVDDKLFKQQYRDSYKRES